MEDNQSNDRLILDEGLELINGDRLGHVAFNFMIEFYHVCIFIIELLFIAFGFRRRFSIGGIILAF